ncbi:hypothetical protein [Laceyella putida]|uniref:DUF948 domain-containing protein n=1 Tax=Laceyella putida TaxID=110101 RepID=A0ABW2RFM5_9BACL
MLKGVLLMVNLLLLALFGWGTVQQIKNQQATNQVMREVAHNVELTKQLTEETNRQLAPLRETSATIEAMNAKLAGTEGKLQNMNRSVDRVIASEQKIIDGLDRLNGSTRTVVGQLETLARQNERLVPTAAGVSSQTAEENRYIQSLSGLTNTSIAELSELNRKFKWLSYLPH